MALSLCHTLSLAARFVHESVLQIKKHCNCYFQKGEVCGSPVKLKELPSLQWENSEECWMDGEGEGGLDDAASKSLNTLSAFCIAWEPIKA